VLIDIISLMIASTAIASKRINEVINTLMQIVVTHMGANFALLFLRNYRNTKQKRVRLSHFSLRASATLASQQVNVKQYQPNYLLNEDDDEGDVNDHRQDEYEEETDEDMSYDESSDSEISSITNMKTEDDVEMDKDSEVAYPRIILEDVLVNDKSILLHNAIFSRYKNDNYVKVSKPLSVYCLLLKSNNQNIGILYLENNLIPSVFTRYKLETVKLLSSQMAVSLENAQYYERMETMNAIKDSFIATTNHELRTPLHGIIGTTSLLEETQLTEIQQEYVNAIRCCSDNLLRMVNDILELSKINAKKMFLSFKRFELIKWIESTMDIVCPQAADKHLMFLYVPMSISLPNASPLLLKQHNNVGHEFNFSSNASDGSDPAGNIR
jgi:GAF domain-containing protein